jgi:hypothetical protein
MSFAVSERASRGSCCSQPTSTPHTWSRCWSVGGLERLDVMARSTKEGQYRGSYGHCWGALMPHRWQVRHGIRHVGRRFWRGKTRRATAAGVTTLCCHATAAGVTVLNFWKIISNVQYDVGWRWFLYENYRSRRDLQLSNFKFFRLRTSRCSKKLYKSLAP